MILNKFSYSLITMTSRRSTLFHGLLTLIIPSVWIHLGMCSNSSIDEVFHKHIEINNQHQEFTNDTPDMNNIVPACELVYQQYLQTIENFTYCEIHNVRPFTLCLTCWKQYQAAANLYAELIVSLPSWSYFTLVLLRL